MGSEYSAIYKTLLLLAVVLYTVPSTVLALDSMHADIIVAGDSSVTVKEAIHIESGEACSRKAP